MLSPRIPRLSPGLCPHRLDARPATPTPSSSTLTNEETPGNARPSLKRQTTAPNPVYSYSRMKKAGIFAGGQQGIWSEEVHTAFLEALQNHPPTSTWRTSHPFINACAQEQTEYYKTIQELIFNKTGQPHSVEQIKEHFSTAFSNSLEATHLIQESTNHVHSEVGILPVLVTDDTDVSCAPSYVSQLYGDIIPYAENGSEIHLLHPSSARADKTSSMSKRRKACNRPTLNLLINIPPPVAHRSLPNIGDVITPDTSISSSSSSALSRPSFAFAFEEGVSPITPIDQCHKGPLVPPEAPRIINVQRSLAGRWIPTPTEGVLPFLTCAAAASSPDSIVSSGSGNEFRNREPDRSGAKELNLKARPKMSRRSLSWLSIPKRLVAGELQADTALASPFATSGPRVLNSPLAISDEHVFDEAHSDATSLLHLQ
ncbi:hypothetical protein DFH11DRAFT_1575121 [Phellopilus nigrolimitatus]|nr:hypothetical protein DFH11DRAFT_1575121 [Phellopilus nigrolimitatus]